MQWFPDFSLIFLLQSYSEGRQRGVLGAHCSLGADNHKGNFGQVSPIPFSFGQMSAKPPQKANS